MLTADALVGSVLDKTPVKLVVNGNVGADTLHGSFWNDELHGGPGADTMYGYDGFDTISYTFSQAAVTINLATGAASGGDALNDRYYAIEGVIGTDFNDMLTGDGKDNYFEGGAGRDTIRGEGGNDSIFGQEGGGTFYGGAGEDRIDGGNENDTIYGGIENDDLRPGRGTNTVYGEDGDDYIEADPSPSIDRLYGGPGTDTLYGYAVADGIDVLDGGTGVDQMSQGAGTAYFYVDNALDYVFDSGTTDADRVFASVSYALGIGARIEILSTTSTSSTGAINLTGNDVAQTIYGNNGANKIDGKGGADTMYGYNGNDSFYVDDAGDKVVEGAGGGTADRVYASVDYTLASAAQIERLSTTDPDVMGDLDLTGNGFAQRIDGNVGENRLEGGGGTDTLYGYGGNDILVVDSLDDVVVESFGGGTDRVMARSSYVLASTGAEIERLTTASGGATTAIDLTGNSYAQQIEGNAGVNRIAGRGGIDKLVGNDGNDIFEFDSVVETGNGSSRDQINDFEDFSDNETIDLSGFAGTLDFIEDDAFSAANQVRAIQSGAHVLIQINITGTSGAEGEILLANTLLSTIDGTDFLL